MPLRVYDQTIRVLKSAVQNAKLGREEELSALRRLDEQARLLERQASGPSFDAFMAEARKQRRGSWRPEFTAAGVIGKVGE